MATLTAKQRKALPKSAFGMPGKKKYPMPDKTHAANAKSRAEQAVKAGRISESTEEKIDAKANKVIKKAGGKSAVDDMTSPAKRVRIEKRREMGITVGRKRDARSV